MGPAFALGLLIWVGIISYAGVQSGLAEIQHQCLSILGALKGAEPDPTCAGKLSGGAGAQGGAGAPAGGGSGAGALAFAQKEFTGCPYVFGGSACHPGIDCSGLTMQAWRSQGVQLPHNASAQHAFAVSHGWGLSGAAGRTTPGALLFFLRTPGTGEIHHVALSMGDGEHMFSADHPGKPVGVEAIFGSGLLVGAAIPSTGGGGAPPPRKK
jgi:cell wall-associated NlpC family hydrolase